MWFTDCRARSWSIETPHTTHTHVYIEYIQYIVYSMYVCTVHTYIEYYTIMPYMAYHHGNKNYSDIRTLAFTNTTPKYTLSLHNNEPDPTLSLIHSTLWLRCVCSNRNSFRSCHTCDG